MLLIYGVTAVVAGTVLIAVGHAFAKSPRPTSLRRFLGCRAFDAIAISLMFGGSLTMLIFLADYRTQPAVLLQMIGAAVLAVGGYLGVHLIRRRTGMSPVAGPAVSTGPLDGLAPAGPEDTAPGSRKRAA